MPKITNLKFPHSLLYYLEENLIVHNLNDTLLGIWSVYIRYVSHFRTFHTLYNTDLIDLNVSFGWPLIRNRTFCFQALQDLNNVTQYSSVYVRCTKYGVQTSNGHEGKFIIFIRHGFFWAAVLPWLSNGNFWLRFCHSLSNHDTYRFYSYKGLWPNMPLPSPLPSTTTTTRRKTREICLINNFDMEHMLFIYDMIRIDPASISLYIDCTFGF